LRAPIGICEKKTAFISSNGSAGSPTSSQAKERVESDGAKLYETKNDQKLVQV
jgi:hypothetical protein